MMAALAPGMFRRHARRFAALPAAYRRRFAAMVMPWLLACLIGFPLLWTEVDRVAQAPQWRARESLKDEAAEILRRTLDSLQRDVAFLGDQAAQAPHEDLSPDSPFARLFLSFAKSSGAFEQVRWLDASGRERLRISMRHGEPEVVPPINLQNQGDRPYFQDTITLPPGSVYVSQFELSTEYGYVERPLEPILNVATPLYEGGQPLGIVAINYRASRLLNRLSALGLRQGLDVYLVNDAGYWLEGPTPIDSWAWQLRRPERALPATQPALWRALQQNTSGRHSDESGDWVFRRVQFDGSAAADQGRSINLVSRAGLRVLVTSNAGQGELIHWRWQLTLATLMALAVLLVARYAWQTLRNLTEEDRQSREIRAANRALTEANATLRNMRDELERAERLSSLGLMVAGVAHELNTPLGSATLSLSTLQQSLSTLQTRLETGLRRSDLDTFLRDARDAMDLAQTAVQRAAGLLQRFKQVAVDRTTMDRRQFDLAEAVLDSHPDLRKWDASNGITLHLELAPNLSMDSYPGPLEQVVANLVNNALVHAFRGRENGAITIRTAASGASHVVVHVADNGVGIDPRSLKRIFDPFYTTNRHAGGTGLGLHIASQMVTEVLGGTLRAQNLSTKGSGMVFTLRLPRVADSGKPPRAVD
ncbi:two component sensor kinase for C4-dicarboxylate transport [Bordetella ansorpii]|uniref:histidine kinase n=2 Tax=Bordetella ansorpii TaxID=288768 RepID=A0A157P7B7_9BORD|nr:two component sensor kinase for C4-dicarboxylate transport [Bordetella ansorpii]